MVESKFKIWTLLAIFSGLLLFIVLLFIFIRLGISSLPLYASIPLLLFLLSIIAWLGYGELRTKAIKVKIESNIITVKNFIGLGADTIYDFKEFHGYKTSILPSEYQAYEYLYLIISGKKKIKISQFYHSNYSEIKKAIAAKTRNLGEEPFNLFQELKDIFKA